VAGRACEQRLAGPDPAIDWLLTTGRADLKRPSGRIDWNEGLSNMNMDERLTDRKGEIARTLIERQLLREDAPLIGIIDFDSLGATINALRGAFPSHFTHAFAAKANSMPSVLSFMCGAGMGCEVASPSEFAAAIQAGFAPTNIVFDSPAKTNPELRRALAVGTVLIVDNFQELARVDGLLSHSPTASVIGIRINPQVGAGNIAATSTASSSSKFGIALRDSGSREALIAAYVARPWLKALHVHVGSQGCPLELAAEGIRAVMDLALSIDDACGHHRIDTIDIGGGLPVNFSDETITPTFKEYAAVLRNRVPELFDGTRRVFTEFGRSVIAKAGFILARVEYTKVMGGRPIAITHAGAQVAARTVYQPMNWPLRISALDAIGNQKLGPLIEQDIAGPCCFAGDLLASGRPLPLLEPGEHVIVHDTGGYYFSSPYIYNSLPPIDIYGVTGPDHAICLEELNR
jgi:diaminopimelate decarboxylase